MTSSPRRAAVIVNPTKVNLAQLRQTVAKAAAAAGWDAPLWYATTPDDHGQRLTRLAVSEGVDLVCAAGGDGTVRAVAEGLRGSTVPLALLPAGTGNLLARNLGVPFTNTEAAAAVAFGGTTRPVDVGRVRIRREVSTTGTTGTTSENGTAENSTEEHLFLVMAGMGIDAAMIANTNPSLKRAVGWLAYVDAAVRSLATMRPFRVHYRLSGKAEHSAHLSTILFANCGTLTGGLELIPDALVDDGLLDIAVLQPTGLLGWFQVWRKVRWENSVLRRSSIGRRIIRLTGTTTEATITYLRTEAASIRLEKAEPIELDGDDFGRAIGADFFVDSSSLEVCVRATE